METPNGTASTGAVEHKADGTSTYVLPEPKVKKSKAPKVRKPEAGVRYLDIDTGNKAEFARLVLPKDDSDPRWVPDLDLKLDRAFVLDLATNGVDVDLDVTENPSFPPGAYPKGSFGINDGRTRVRAIPEANKIRKAKGLPPLVVGLKIREREDVEAMKAAARLNSQRKKEDPITIARKISRFIDVNLTEQEIGETMGLSVAQVEQYKSLLILPLATQKMIMDGKLSVNAAAALAKLDPQAIQRRAEEVVAAAHEGKGKANKVAKGDNGPDRLPAKGIKKLIDELKEAEKEASAAHASRFEAARYALETVLDARKADGLWHKLKK